MRRLNRTAVTAPTCLANLQHGQDNWNTDQVASCKNEIRGQLEKLQGRLCAYCEGSLDSLGQHIEHLWSRTRYPQRTFDWSNLLLSCGMSDSCGHYKDNGADAYNPTDLIDPSQHDADQFFHFRSDGNIEPIAELSSTDTRRATETLRVFNLNLNHPRSLCAERRRVLVTYKSQEPDILKELEDFSPEERADYIQEEIEKTSKEPFGTIIRHFFSG